MQLIIGGCRGTSPIADVSTVQYGGDTTSFFIGGRDGSLVVIDAGTGIRNLQHYLKDKDNTPLLLLFTHFHLDHIAGLPTFTPAYDPAWHIRIAARELEGRTAEQALNDFMTPPYWPIPLDTLKADIRFDVLPDVCASPLRHGDLEVRWCPLHHPGGSTLYRIDEPASGSSIVVATDMEWGESTPEEQNAFVELCSSPRGADILLFDGKYTQAEYETYRGWGHSTWQEGVELARRTGAKKLLITHHAALADDLLNVRRDEVRAAWPQADLAVEGARIELG